MPRSRPTAEDQRKSRANRRDKARRSFRTSVSFVTLRMAELYRVFERFYRGELLPHDDDGRDSLKLAFQVLSTTGNAATRMAAIATTWAPWIPPDELAGLIAEVVANPRRFKADTIAARLGITAAIRAELNLRTIGAIDFPIEQRRTHRREMQRLAREQKRRAAGIVPIKQARASRASPKPWLAAGMSRSSWYRHRNETQHAA